MQRSLTAGTMERLLRGVVGEARGATVVGDRNEIQPVHLLIGGAHRFRASTVARMGELARDVLVAYAPDYVSFARAMGLPGAERLTTPQAAAADEVGVDWLARTVYARVQEKLAQAPVESYRVDFEDGYGYRSDAEEDEAARVAAGLMAEAAAAGTLARENGIRIKPLTSEAAPRAARTLDIFLTHLLRENAGVFPANFSVLLPKVSRPEQAQALNRLLAALEETLGLPHGRIPVELMVETPDALVDAEGRLGLRQIVRAAGGRCRCVHFGAYDYTASLGIGATYQELTHPANTLARNLMQLSLAGSNVWLADSPNMALPISPHRGEELSPEQKAENRIAVHTAWQRCYVGVTNGLRQGFMQGWDIHPHQLPARYAAVYTHFRQDLRAKTDRLRNFVEEAGTATRVGTVFDDAATARALLNDFRQAYACGAITVAEVEATGLSLTELNRTTFGA